MQIWPAIDLRRGRCVRLQQGDYDRETVFGDDPAAMAQRWVAAGARRLHLVDLDAARGDATEENRQAIRAILAAVDVPCQLGGGVRQTQHIDELLDLGLQRLVVGSAALRQPDWFAQQCEAHPGQLVAGIDARNGLVATDGWLETSDTPASELARALRDRTAHIAAIVYTDIARDGMLSGPNVDQLQQMESATDIPVVASGGVSSSDDIRLLQSRGTHAVIVGRAIYEGKLDLSEAIQIARDSDSD